MCASAPSETTENKLFYGEIKIFYIYASRKRELTNQSECSTTAVNRTMLSRRRVFETCLPFSAHLQRQQRLTLTCRSIVKTQKIDNQLLHDSAHYSNSRCIQCTSISVSHAALNQLISGHATVTTAPELKSTVGLAQLLRIFRHRKNHNKTRNESLMCVERVVEVTTKNVRTEAYARCHGKHNDHATSSQRLPPQLLQSGHHLSQTNREQILPYIVPRTCLFLEKGVYKAYCNGIFIQAL